MFRSQVKYSHPLESTSKCAVHILFILPNSSIIAPQTIINASRMKAAHPHMRLNASATCNYGNVRC